MILTILVICLVWSVIGVTIDIKFDLTSLPHWAWIIIVGPVIWVLILGWVLYDGMEYGKRL